MENGRVVLVSGANRGIGREMVRQLTERGITTILGSRDEEKGRRGGHGRRRARPTIRRNRREGYSSVGPRRRGRVRVRARSRRLPTPRCGRRRYLAMVPTAASSATGARSPGRRSIDVDRAPYVAVVGSDEATGVLYEKAGR